MLHRDIHSMSKASVSCRPEMVVGWYHSHPGFGCWLSGVDINTQQVSLTSVTRCLSRCMGTQQHVHRHSCCVQQLVAAMWLVMQSFEQLNPRAVAVVVDPIQSVKGKVVIDAFR